MAEEWIKKEKMAKGKLRKRERKGVHFEFNLNQFPQKPPFAFQKQSRLIKWRCVIFMLYLGFAHMICTNRIFSISEVPLPRGRQNLNQKLNHFLKVAKQYIVTMLQCSISCALFPVEKVW